jgi:hypothetical protein
VADCNFQLPRRKNYKRSSAAASAAVREAEAWNHAVPPGTPVCVHRDNGEKVRTVARGPASILCGSAVAWFEDISGAYALDHAHPVGSGA